MRRTKSDRSPYIKITVIVISLIFLLVAGFLLMQKWEESMGRFPEQESGNSAVVYDGVEYVLKENVETFLIMGLDKFEGTAAADSYNNDKQADFLMLFVFDNEAKQCTAIHINRDTMAAVNVLGVAGNKVDTLTKQIALAHTYGNGKDVSCRNTADSVSSLLMGMKVNHYISLTLDAVPVFNDLVGGVEVIVLDDFSGIDDTLIKGESVTLMGETALKYVRTRKDLDDSSNSTRMKRQQQYIHALHEKTQRCIASDEEFIIEASLKMSEYIVSDRSVTQLQALAEKFNEYEFIGIRDIEGESKIGAEFMEFYPNEDSVKKMIIELFYERRE